MAEASAPNGHEADGETGTVMESMPGDSQSEDPFAHLLADSSEESLEVIAEAESAIAEDPDVPDVGESANGSAD